MSDQDRTVIKLLLFSASMRQASLNTKLAKLVARHATERGVVVDMASMRDFDCTSYDGDDETASGVPPGANELCRRLTSANAFAIVSPEYNAAMPGVLKNVIDWTSRIRPQPFDSRHGLLLSASPSLAGGNRGLWSLRVPLEHLGARIFPDMFSLAMAHEAFDGERLADDALQDRLEKTLDNFIELVVAATHYPAMKRAWIEVLGEPPAEAGDRVDVRA
ncbi:MAG: NAD(P)H-dependent oxidoreductase [Kofleriaceae bacterium]|nr:NAD(P)H-dependent oxidoreductase [Kofleriaceae bacterium]